MSTMAYASAARNGWSNGSTTTAEPRRMRRVRCAAAASHTGGAGIAPYSWKWCSATQKESNPSASAASTCSKSSS
jgi:hypothetical protein